MNTFRPSYHGLPLNEVYNLLTIRGRALTQINLSPHFDLN